MKVDTVPSSVSLKGAAHRILVLISSAVNTHTDSVQSPKRVISPTEIKNRENASTVR